MVPAAIASAQRLSIGESEVQLITPVYFVATKLEAFRHRGGGDVTVSHDLEDIVSVVDGRAEIVADIAAADADVRAYIVTKLARLMANREFREALPGFLLPDVASQARRPLLEERLRAIASLT